MWGDNPTYSYIKCPYCSKRQLDDANGMEPTSHEKVCAKRSIPGVREILKMVLTEKEEK